MGAVGVASLKACAGSPTLVTSFRLSTEWRLALPHLFKSFCNATDVLLNGNKRICLSTLKSEVLLPFSSSSGSLLALNSWWIKGLFLLVPESRPEGRSCKQVPGVWLPTWVPSVWQPYSATRFSPQRADGGAGCNLPAPRWKMLAWLISVICSIF